MGKKKFLVLHRFPSRLEAEMAAEMLNRAGISSIIQSEDIGLFGPGGSAVPSGASLLVREDDFKNAETRLKGFLI